VTWEEFEVGAPELAALARAEFERYGMVLVGTVRKDGSPRISSVLPHVLEGELYLGMMWRSRKAVDLLHNPRLVLHNAICTNRGDEVEIGLHGQAVEIRDEEVRRRYVRDRSEWSERDFHLFSVDIQSVGLVRYEGGEQHVKVWPRGAEFTRLY
jgi:pyridoxamine 5'-phosphate oxidase-like protein